jgi:hypothetical protein
LPTLAVTTLGIPSEPHQAVTCLRNRASFGVPMSSQPNAVSGQQEVSPVSPVIAGGTWLGDDDRRQSLTLQLRLPISAEELAAALCEDDQLCPADLIKDENVWCFRRGGDRPGRAQCHPAPPRRDPGGRGARDLSQPGLAGDLPSPRSPAPSCPAVPSTAPCRVLPECGR